MNEVYEFLTKNRTGFLATVDAENHPHARAVGLALIREGNLYYATANTKPMYAQMKQNPNVELAVSTPDFSMNLRVAGKAVLCDDMELKKEVMTASPALQSIYSSSENPIFTLMYIVPSSARFWSFAEDRTVQL